MQATDLERLRYPRGRFQPPTAVNAASRDQWITTLEELPRKLRASLIGLNALRLDTPYRPEGWTVRQLVHHIADSHLNAYTRFKLGLTENTPTIKPYDERAWAELTDSREMPVQAPLLMIRGIHARGVYLLRRLPDADWERTITHPEWSRPLSLHDLLALYAWHSDHHLAHITELRRRHGF